jgi:hypothetical protein
MWTLERGVEACGALQRIVEPFGFSVALYGGVLITGTGNDLPLRTSTAINSQFSILNGGGSSPSSIETILQTA